MPKPTLIGAIAGDVIGSIFEWKNVKTTDFNLFSEKSKFTDDTVLTIALADTVLNHTNFEENMKKYGNQYASCGFGRRFKQWLADPGFPVYDSYGNGAAMRVSPIGYSSKSEEELMERARQTTVYTHNHPESVKAAQAVSLAIYLAQRHYSKQQIKQRLVSDFNYNLDRTLAQIRPEYKFDVSCQGSVSEAIIAFLESSDYESSIRLAISLGGDSDTIAAICGSISAAFYQEIPVHILENVRKRLPEEFLLIIDRFDAIYGNY